MFHRFVVLLFVLVWLCAVPVCAQPPGTAAASATSASVALRPDCDPILEEFVAEIAMVLFLDGWYGASGITVVFVAWATGRR